MSITDPADDAVLAVLAVVDRVDTKETIDAIVAAVVERVPAYDALVGQGLDVPVRRVVEAGCELVLKVVGDGRPVADEDLVEVLDACVALLFWGTSPDDVPVASDVLGSVLWERLVGAARPLELPHLLRAGHRLFVITEAVRTVHDALREKDLDGLPYEESLSRHLLRVVVAGHTDAVAREAGVRLQLDPDLLVHPFVLVQGDADPVSRGGLARALRSAGILATTLPDRICGLAPAGPWAAELPEGVVAVVAPPENAEPGSLLWDELHDAATVALDRGRRGVVELHEMAVECMLMHAPSVRRRLAGLVADLRTESAAGKVDLLETLRAVLGADLNRARIADLLAVHTSTVRYRTDRLETALSMQVRRPQHRSVLELALRTDALPGQAPARPGVAAADEPPIAERVLAGVAARLDLDALAARAADSVRRLDGFVALSPRDEAELQQGIRAFLSAMLTAFREPRPGGEWPQAPAAAIVDSQVRRGVPVAEAVRAVSKSGRLLWEALLEEATDVEASGLPAVAVGLARLASPTTLGVGAAAPGGSAPSLAATSEYVIATLSAGASGQPHVTALARTWGLDPEQVWRPIVAIPAEGDAPAKLGAAMRAFGWLAAVRHGRVVALVPPGVSALRLPTAPALIALGTPAPLTTLDGHVGDVLLLADVAARRGASGTVRFADWEVDMLVAANPVTAERLRRRFVDLLGGPEQGLKNDLLLTVVRHLEHDLDRARTARAMHLHPNSLDHRLRRITRLTGRSFTRTDDVLELAVVAAAHAARAR